MQRGLRVHPVVCFQDIQTFDVILLYKLMILVKMPVGNRTHIK
jgi:hypothetical protein